MNTPVVIDYYTDVLCVWAWIAQRRIDELHAQFGERITIQHHYMDVFGDVPTKMATQWQNRGGYVGFAQHVQHAARDFEDAPVHDDVWVSTQPLTSANAHLILSAITLSHGAAQSVTMARHIRAAFFVDAKDIAETNTLLALAEQQGLQVAEIEHDIRSGAAMAALMGDYQRAKQNGMKGSPSYVLNEGRQTLYGNVGYRVLEANINELLKHPSDEASWC